MGLLRILLLFVVSVPGLGAERLTPPNPVSDQGSASQEGPAMAVQTSPAKTSADAKPAAPPPPATQGPAPAVAKDSPPPPLVTLASAGGNNLQLGIRVNGTFSYPFIFSWDAPASLGLALSPSGVITGNPSQTSDQSAKITVTDSNGTQIAAYPITLHFGAAPIIILGAAPAAAAADTNDAKAKAQIIPNSIYAGGDMISGTLVAAGSGANSNAANNANATGNGSCPSGGTVTTLSVQQVGDPVATTTTDCKGAFSYQFNHPLLEWDTVTVSAVSPAGATPASLSALARPHLFGEELRAIVGYQQSGASSSSFNQNWFLDFYISRPLAFRIYPEENGEGTNHKWRWWGNVRIASFPQAGNQTLADVATGFTAQLGALKLNQLAQGAEFLSGFEYALLRSFPFRGLSENSRQSFTLGFVGGFGATGFFSSPSSNVQVFYVPAAGTPASKAFQASYPNVTTERVGFIAPDVERFPKQFLGGLRLTTHYFDPSGMPLTSAPAMLQITAGQNQVITGGRWQGVVGRIEAFYPLPFGNRGNGVAGAFSSIYLFGETELRVGAAKVPPALVLQPDTTTPAYDPTVTLVATPTTRDTYRFGFGLDLVGFISQLTGGAGKGAAAAASSSQNPAGAQQKPAQQSGNQPLNP
jgi:hypothetical protein